MLSVIFEDEYLLVIDKPPGLVVTSSETQIGHTLEDILKKRFKLDIDRGGIVHRLDKDTSGLIVVGKTEGVVKNLQSQFKNRTVKKEYLALVHGLVEKMGRVEEPIGRNPGDREKFTVMEEGKEAVTEYTPIGKFQFSINLQSIFNDLNKQSFPPPNGGRKIQLRKLEKMDYNRFTLLSCKPMTGRTHQIRVHLKHINHPVVADDKYTGRKMLRLDHRWCKRQFLHAKLLECEHPVSGKWMRFESKLPEDLDQVLNKLHGTFN